MSKTSNLKTWVNIASGKRYPEFGCENWFRLDTKETWKNGEKKVKQKFEIFMRGQGWLKKCKLKEWRQEEIPDYAGPQPNPNEPIPNDKEWKAYVEKYGVTCAQEFLHCCDMMKPSWASELLTPQKNRPSPEALLWFETTFECNAMCLAVPLISAFCNTYSFDIIAFERVLKNQYDYDPDSGTESMRDFITRKWDKHTCEQFTKWFLKT